MSLTSASELRRVIDSYLYRERLQLKAPGLLQPWVQSLFYEFTRKGLRPDRHLDF